MHSPEHLAPRGRHADRWRVAARLASMLPLAAIALAGVVPAEAASQVAGPIQIGPSWGQGDPQHSSALLSTIVANHGGMADRIIRVECPGTGQVTLRNGTRHQDVAAPTIGQQQAALAQQQQPEDSRPMQNGLDLPPGLHGQTHPVTALLDLTRATQPITDGALVPCSLYFAHAGQRIVVFTIGEQPQPTDEP